VELEAGPSGVAEVSNRTVELEERGESLPQAGSAEPVKNLGLVFDEMAK